MSIGIEPTKKVTPPPPDNPWYFGSRYVGVMQSNGTIKQVKTPLTLEDVLHPQDGDSISNSILHGMGKDYLCDVFRLCAKDDSNILVLHNTGVYWDHPNLEHHCPDLAVIFGVKTHKPDRHSFCVLEEGTRPHSIIELVSPNSRKNDVETKMIEYHLAEVRYYFLFDMLHYGGDWALRGYQWTPTGYLPLNSDPHGRLWFKALRIWLAAEGRNIVCYNGKTNERFPTFEELLADQAHVRNP